MGHRGGFRLPQMHRPAHTLRQRAGRGALVVLLSGLLSVLIAPAVVHAAPPINITVADGDVTGLKNAIDTANSNPGTQVNIFLAENGTYNIAAPSANDADGATALPPVQSNAIVNIYGRNATLTVTTQMRHFKNAGILRFFEKVTLQGGTAISSGPTGNGLGGAILNDGQIYISSVTFKQNQAKGKNGGVGAGGAIYVRSGSAEVNTSRFF